MNSVIRINRMGKGLVGLAVGLLLAMVLGMGQGRAQEMPGGCWVQPDGSVWCTVVQVFLPIINK